MESIRSSRSQGCEDYLSRLRCLASVQGVAELNTALSKLDTNNTKAYVHHYRQRLYTSSPTEIIAAVTKTDPESDINTVCIIENIGPKHVEALGSAWDLDPNFFIEHAANRRREHLWTPYVFMDPQRSVFSDLQPKLGIKKYDHIDGVFEYHGLNIHDDAEINSSPNYFERHCFWSTWVNSEAVNSSTRLSYYHVYKHLYLLLVDAPLQLLNRYDSMPRRIRPTLRLPYAVKRGGLLLPHLLEEHDQKAIHYSLFESLVNVFRHRWQRDLLCNHEGTIPASPFCYLLSNSLWQTNLRYLNQEITRISFEEIRNPTSSINETLHDRREQLVAFMKSGLTETTANIPEAVTVYWEMFREKGIVMQDATGSTPATAHRNTLDKAIDLEIFLMETFRLLMSSISVQDTKTSVEQSLLSHQQSLRATQLTILASIYVPLSFVTSVFGMNLKELNGSSLSIWAFFVGIFIAMIVTALIFLGLQLHSKRIGSRKECQKQRPQSKADKIENIRCRTKRRDNSKEPKSGISMA